MQADVRKVPIDREESTKRAEQLKNKEPLEKVCPIFLLSDVRFCPSNTSEM